MDRPSDVDAILREADALMYRAKRSDKNRVLMEVRGLPTAA